MYTKLFNALKILLLAGVLSVGLSYALAWTPPDKLPPEGNVPAPINAGPTLLPQKIVGGLIITATTTTERLVVTATTTTGTLVAGGLGVITDSITTKGVTFNDGTVQKTVTNSGSHGKAMFTTSGTWVAPAGVTTVWISMAGGGGGGANTRNSNGNLSKGYGGGGGGSFLSKEVSVFPATSYSIVVGVGGPAASIGTSSKFGLMLTATGGGIGAAGTPNGTNGTEHHGGSSIFGAGANNANQKGGGYGGGGAGGNVRINSDFDNYTTSGSSGSSGFVLVEW